MEDTMIYFGDAVKALDDNGRVGALGIRFSDGSKKDLAGEYFTAKTYLGPQEGDGAECTFDHGFPIKSGLEEYADHTFAPVKANRQKLGIWVETVLDLSDEYEKAVFQMAKKGKLGWSSGSAGHRVKKDSRTGEIKSWPVAEWALTPRPCEPDNYGTTLPLKSLSDVKFVDLNGDEPAQDAKPLPAGSLAAKLSQYIDDLVDDGRSRDDLVKHLAREAMIDTPEVEKILSGEHRRPANSKLKAFGRVLELPFETLRQLADRSAPKSIKDLYQEERAARTDSVWDMQSSYCCVVKRIAEAAKAARAVGEDYAYEAPLKEVGQSYAADVTGASLEQVRNYVESPEMMDDFYLKALFALTQEDFAAFSKGTDLEDHSQLVVTAVRDITARFKSNHEARKTQKAGRVLSEKNRTRLAGVLERMAAAVTECQNLLDETKPMASDTEKRAALTRHLFLRHERRKNGLHNRSVINGKNP